uniref:Uncharacterized protein n=1 Tax=Peronospora matthiolae TaxID=2874970 RepID=A0AAV1UVU8_9STRA
MLSSEESPHESHTGAMRLAKAALVPAVIILASDGILLNAYGLDDDETEAYARRFL